MAHATMHKPAGTSRPSPPKRSGNLGVPILLQIVAMIGIAALLYPTASDWFATLTHNGERSGYVRQVAGYTDAERQAALQAARDYNAQLPASALLDPYAENATDAAKEADQAAQQRYDSALKVDGTKAIAELVYPRLNIGLPVFHGAGEEAITQGVGHLYGSSLPVGGPSTHSVLTSHSGQVHASLFSNLTKAKIGDVFEIRVLGETLYYKVDGLETVEPFITDSLNVVPGADRVTLFTCTPIGINSHRYLVHASRTDAPPADGDYALAGDGRTAGFPWWAIAFLGGSGIAAYLLFAPRKPRNTRSTKHIDEKRQP